ncbi:GNAT family N-acetyltransferase [Maribius pontilimi]|uniref:GNAT family N-acetyltransferase n=1 Tax=Palleronia pontilimi TaxID=1964209 RepID=A0A934MHN6_9RHOB|nr:GNAT family N-acetyltransferase [Palleronia pontilimi]MBJ3763474.1 GNAT family N-acetyltransferase [Palleronia pontilimi]
MSAKLRLAAPDDLPKLDKLMAACHAELKIKLDDDARTMALSPLLDGQVPGAAYLIGPPSSPVGYVLLRFGYSVQDGGMVARIDELFIRPPVRGREMASEALRSVAKTLRAGGIASLQADLPDGAPEKLFRRLLFKVSAQNHAHLAL